jgi:aspartate-semialdehyde dehydrogenase
MTVLNAPLLQEGIPHGAFQSKKVQALLALALFAGLGLIASIHGGHDPASAISMLGLTRAAWPVAKPMQQTKAWGPMQPVGWTPGQGSQPSKARQVIISEAFGEAAGTVTILGATGVVGQELLRLLPKAWPDAKLQLFASKDKEFEVDGKKYQAMAASKLETDEAPKGDIAFVALDDAFSKKYVPRLLELGYRVVDKSNTYRMDPNVPLVVPGVNSDLITEDVKLVANPNCNTIPFCLAVAPIQRKYGLKGATVSSYQAVSGAGIGPLDDFLSKCKDGYSSQNRIGTQFNAGEYAGNVVPHNGGTDDSGFSSEERKLIFESRKILRLPDFDVSAQCCRVPVAVGHYENAWVTFNEKVTPETAKGVLTDSAQAPFVVYKDGPVGDGMSSLASVANRDKSVVGRVRPDPRDKQGATLCMTVAGDNLRLGAATNAVRVASCWFPSKDPDLQAKCFPPA